MERDVKQIEHDIFLELKAGAKESETGTAADSVRVEAIIKRLGEMGGDSPAMELRPYRVQFYNVGNAGIGWTEILPDLEYRTIADAVDRQRKQTGELCSPGMLEIEYDATEKAGTLRVAQYDRIVGHFMVRDI